jgi:hypothetical protein
VATLRSCPGEVLIAGVEIASRRFAAPLLVLRAIALIIATSVRILLVSPSNPRAISNSPGPPRVRTSNSPEPNPPFRTPKSSSATSRLYVKAFPVTAPKKSISNPPNKSPQTATRRMVH